MINSRTISLLMLMFSSMTTANEPLTYHGRSGPGVGKHIVFLAGDHAYRSEESLPALARIMAKHHGFKCTVLFNIDNETGDIVVGNSNMPGIEALDTADLAVVFLRFQNFPPEQMKHFDAYLQRGGPVVGLRTATHAFRTPASAPYAKYSFDGEIPGYELGFGHQVLGQSWIGHYGKNHSQSTRVSMVQSKADHPIMRGASSRLHTPVFKAQFLHTTIRILSKVLPPNDQSKNRQQKGSPVRLACRVSHAHTTYVRR